MIKMKPVRIKIVDENQKIKAQAVFLTEEEAIIEAAKKNIIVAYN